MDFNIMIPILILASFAGTGLMIYAMRKSQAKEAAIKALVQERGWRYEKTTETRGQIRVTRISSRSANWVLEERFGSSENGTGSRSTSQSLTWTDPDTGIPSGLAVMSLQMRDDKAANMEKFLDKMGDGVMGKHMTKTFFGVVADRATELDAVEAVGAAGAILATADARDALMPIAYHEALLNVRTSMPKGTMPSIIRSPEGLQLSLKSTIASAEHLDALVSLGETLSAALKSHPDANPNGAQASNSSPDQQAVPA